MKSVWTGMPSSGVPRWFTTSSNLARTLPILANVLLESDGDTLRLTATDLEVGARVSVPAKVATGVPSRFPHASSSRSSRSSRRAGLTLKVQENSWVAMRCGGARTSWWV